MDYKKVYDAIIENAKKQKRIKIPIKNKDYIYYERHHIIPKCMNGNDLDENLVLLTGREHFFCHLLLHKIYPNSVALLSSLFILLKHTENTFNSRFYERTRIKLAEKMSDARKGKNNPMYEKSAYANKTDEEMELIGKKISLAVSGKKRGHRYINDKGEIHITKGVIPENCKPIGVLINDDIRKKMSESAKKRGYNGCGDYDKHGENNPNYNNHMSDESKKRIGTINAQKMKGKKWFNDGSKNILVYPENCPRKFTPGRCNYKRKLVS